MQGACQPAAGRPQLAPPPLAPLGEGDDPLVDVLKLFVLEPVRGVVIENELAQIAPVGATQCRLLANKLVLGSPQDQRRRNDPLVSRRRQTMPKGRTVPVHHGVECAWMRPG